MKEKRQLKHTSLSNTFFALKWHYKISPVYTVYLFLNTVIGNVITTFEHTFLTAYIIDCIEMKRPITSVLAFLIPVAIAVAIKVIVSPMVNVYYGPKFEAKFKKAVNLTLYEKAVKMEISKYDNSEFYNDFVWAMRQSPNHITGTLSDFSGLVSFVVNIIITGSFIIVTDKLTLLIAAVIVPVAVFVPRLINKLVVKREEELVPIRRKRDYINRVFYLADFIKDIKIGGIAEKLKKDFKDSSDNMEKPIVKFAKKIVPLQVLSSSVADIMVDGVFLLYLFYQVIVMGKYGLGLALGLYNSGNKFINSLYNFSYRFPTFQNHSLYIDKLRTFLDTENEMPDDGTLAVPSGGDIELESVEFTYKGNEKPTINGISMSIKKGEKIALVGYNGAGKTTLIKLILRLYDPTSGCISFGEHNLKEYPLKDYRRKYGVLFQDFEIIAASVGTNISMSDGEFNREKADNVLEKVAFSERLKTLPDGYETQLTKEFSDKGVNLSGGEAQKLALARVLYSSSDVIILDEPSSALDPIAEYELNKAVTELSGDKTVIIISHRLSTTRFVDKIYMLEKGKIIEQGDHEALLKQNGKYAEMFKSQAEKYVS